MGKATRKIIVEYDFKSTMEYGGTE